MDAPSLHDGVRDQPMHPAEHRSRES